jgi:hypothetical protein
LLEYTFAPKVMCTSLRSIMNERMAGTCSGHNCSMYRFNPRLRKGFNLAAMTRFFIMCDPFERLVSA